jgi:hypothetical protein
MKKKKEKAGAVLTKEKPENYKEEIIDVLSLEVLGPIKRTLELWDANNCGATEGTESAALYGLRDACILATENLKAICKTVERDIGKVQIYAPWGRSFLDRRTYEEAFLQPGQEVTS